MLSRLPAGTVAVPEWFLLGSMPALPHSEVVVWLHAFALLSQGREWTTRTAASVLGLSFRRVQMTVASLVSKQLLLADHINGRALRLALPPTAIVDDRGLSPTAIVDDRGPSTTAIHGDRGPSTTAIHDDRGPSATAIHGDRGPSATAIHGDRGPSATAIHGDRGPTSNQALSDGTAPATHASAGCLSLTGRQPDGGSEDFRGRVPANADVAPPAIHGRDFSGEQLRDWVMEHFPASGKGGAGGWRKGQALRYVAPLLDVEAPEGGDRGQLLRAGWEEITAYLAQRSRDPNVLAGRIPIAIACHEPLDLRAWLVKNRRADAKAAQVRADRERAASSPAANVQAVTVSAEAAGVLGRLDAAVRASVADRPTRPTRPGVANTQPGGVVPPPAPVVIPGLSRVGSGPSAPRR